MKEIWKKEKNICDYNCTDCWNYWNSKQHLQLSQQQRER